MRTPSRVGWTARLDSIWVLVPTTPTIHLVNDFKDLSCAFPVDPDVLAVAADVQTREQSVAEAKSNLDTELLGTCHIASDAELTFR